MGKEDPAMTSTQGLTIIYTGDGKGKTTASLGLALRAAGNGMKVCIRQFIKGTDNTGEHQMLKLFADKIDIQILGHGFLDQEMSAAELEAEHAAASQALAKVKGEMLAGGIDMLILDEIIYLFNFGLLEEEEILDLIRCKPPALHLLLTGRGASEGLIAAADLVTEMLCSKHPYAKGTRAQKGIEF